VKLKMKNLGPLRQTEFEMGDFTIICGKNNTGKTYATYALYGFLSFWEESFFLPVDEEKIETLLNEGSLIIELSEYLDDAANIVKQACEEYSKKFTQLFASSEELFSNTLYEVKIDKHLINTQEKFDRTYGSAKKDQLNIKKGSNETLEISLLIEKEGPAIIQRYNLQRSIGNSIKEIIFSKIFPHPFIASAERTGAAIFRTELDFARNRLIEQMSSMERDINPFELLDKVYADYALPVRRNVDFARNVVEIFKRQSFIAKHHKALLVDFNKLIEGEYKVVRNKLYFVPNNNKKLRLTMDESSSAVRSLLDIGFYLRHVARPNDLLMVDEPELNLHPENQRKIARLFARLVNVGIKVFITTHSDYIIKELNTLIMLNQKSALIDRIREKEKYLREELIKPDQLRVYMSRKDKVLFEGNTKRVSALTLVRADIDPQLGIEAESFDNTIDEMNRIQESLLFI
jgi:predicted ATPase